MTTLTRHWNEISARPLSLEGIRELHAPGSHYRVSPNRYPVGAAFCGASRAGRIYVLAGACSKTVGAFHVELGAGMFADYPAGEFQFQVEGASEVHLVNVWLLPEHLWGENDA